MSLPTPRGVSLSTKLAVVLAALSVGVAAWLSLQPHRTMDLYRISGWTSQWLGGAHLYGPASNVDYPPWAIVTLSPLALVPGALLPWVWMGVNLIALAYTARRLAPSLGIVFWLVIAAGALRTLNQFSLVALALALAGTSTTTSGPLWLGLSLMKPQIGLVFWLHAIWQRQWRLAITSLLVPLVLTCLYAAHAHVAVWTVPAAYGQSLHGLYDEAFWGQTDITPMLRGWWPGASAVALTLLVAGLVFAPLARTRPLLGLALASLLALRHLSYDLILLLPFLATLDGAALWLGALLLVADPAAVLGLFAPDAPLTRHADRIVICALWLGAILIFWRRRPEGGAVINRAE